MTEDLQNVSTSENVPDSTTAPVSEGEAATASEAQPVEEELSDIEKEARRVVEKAMARGLAVNELLAKEKAAREGTEEEELSLDQIADNIMAERSYTRTERDRLKYLLSSEEFRENASKLKSNSEKRNVVNAFHGTLQRLSKYEQDLREAKEYAADKESVVRYGTMVPEIRAKAVERLTKGLEGYDSDTVHRVWQGLDPELRAELLDKEYKALIDGEALKKEREDELAQNMSKISETLSEEDRILEQHRRGI